MPKTPLSLKARALKYLSLREHSRLELKRKLLPYLKNDLKNDLQNEVQDELQNHAQLEALLDRLEASQLLSEARFSAALIHRRSKRYGHRRIFAELQSHGIDILGTTRSALMRDELDRACTLLQRKYQYGPQNNKERARYLRFLQQRGFSLETAKAALLMAWQSNG